MAEGGGTAQAKSQDAGLPLPAGPIPPDTISDWDRWYDRKLAQGDPGVIAASLLVFVAIVGTFVLQIALVVVLAFDVYPTASGATEKTVVLVSIFGALSVFFVELRATFTQVILYRFLTRQRRRPKRG